MVKTVRVAIRQERGRGYWGQFTIRVDTREQEQFRRVGVLQTIEREAITEGDRLRARAAEELRSYELHRYRRPGRPGVAAVATKG